MPFVRLGFDSTELNNAPPWLGWGRGGVGGLYSSGSKCRRMREKKKCFPSGGVKNNTCGGFFFHSFQLIFNLLKKKNLKREATDWSDWTLSQAWDQIVGCLFFFHFLFLFSHWRSRLQADFNSQRISVLGGGEQRRLAGLFRGGGVAYKEGAWPPEVGRHPPQEELLTFSVALLWSPFTSSFLP